jgi:hypothetical protein
MIARPPAKPATAAPPPINGVFDLLAAAARAFPAAFVPATAARRASTALAAGVGGGAVPRFASLERLFVADERDAREGFREVPRDRL